jgi:hypothetical protein
MKHDPDESGFECGEKHLLPQALHVAEAIALSNVGGEAWLCFATQNETVNALKGDVPEGSLERLGQPSRYLTVVCNALMSGPNPQLCRGHCT